MRRYRPERPILQRETLKKQSSPSVLKNILEWVRPLLYIGVIIGLLLSLFYYVRIGYFPIMNLHALYTLIGVLAVTAVVFAMLLAAMFIFPAIFWGEGWLKDYMPEKKNNYWFILAWYIFPVGFLANLTMDLFFLKTIWVSFIPILGYALYLFFAFRRKKEDVFRINKKQYYILSYVYHTFISSVVFALAWLLVLKFSTEIGIFAYFFSGIVLLVLSSLAVLEPNSSVSKTVFRLVVGIFTLIIVVVYQIGLPKTSQEMMSFYKFGSFEVSKLVLSEDGCKTFEFFEINPRRKGGDMCEIQEKVTILSRLGEEVYVDVNGTRFTFPSKNLISLELPNSPKKPKDKATEEVLKE
jgi:hypothetical protein